MATIASVDALPQSQGASHSEGRDHGATVSVYLTHFQPGGGPGLHRHPYEETFIIQEGTALFTVDGEPVEAGAGQIVVVPAATPHKFVNSGEDVLRQVNIHPSERFIQEDLDE